jgi:hypothetical protein
MLMANLVYITTYVSGEFRISYLGLGPTEVRLILILTNIIVFFVGNPIIQTKFGIYSVYDVIISLLAVLLFGIYIGITFVTARQLSIVEGGTKK